jgi:ribosomal protein S18 acetylase RimI-like enzyme
MLKQFTLESISIRSRLQPGDIGYITYLHGKLYHAEYAYGIGFESYVANGLHEFYSGYNELLDSVWVCEYENQIVGFLLLMHRADQTCQLRYFLIVPEFRGIGLGNKLMQLFMDDMKSRKYQKAYLWTTSELEQAGKLYVKYGFRLTEEKNSDFFGKTVTEQRYDYVDAVK